MPLDLAGLWPTMSDTRRAELLLRAAAIEDAGRSLAEALSVYAGGGAPAHTAREAADGAATIIEWLQA